MFRFRLVLLYILIGSISCKINNPGNSSKDTTKAYNPIQWVDPMIGTGGHGHTYPGATVPFGLVQLSPDTRLDGWDGCSGYHYSDSVIYGFSHTHLQGTGVSDLGDILFMPTNYKIKNADKWNDAYKSTFNHEDETATAGYYKVKLADYNIQAELTATERTGIHRYKFAKGDSCRLFIDMMHRDELLYYDIEPIGDTAIQGYRVSKSWAEEQHCYFYALFSKPFKNFTQLDITYTEQNQNGQARQILEQVQVFSLAFDPCDELIIKVGISGTDLNGARYNLIEEAPHWNFDQYKNSAEKKWNDQLSKIQLQTTDTKHLKNFYTSIYHSCTTPNIWNDVDGRFRGMDAKIHKANGYNRYTVFSLWDTFRALHPLLVKLEPQRTGDFIRTFLAMYQESGHLPIWELASNETNCMIGYHAVSVITDAYAKGIRDFDTDLALEAMISTATSYGNDKLDYTNYGYLPAHMHAESVSKTLEYAYNDWCIAQFAKLIGRMDEYQTFIQRAQYWKSLYDPNTTFMRARNEGGFYEPFDPFEVNFNYTEANAWQYNLFVPHDIATLIKYLGGKDALESKLDEIFTTSSKTTGREQADITGLIGQYAHGNEPSHHLAYLYLYTNHPEKCTERVEQILNTQYQPTPDGLCGNEDCGQMSAWYVMSAMGEYAVCPGVSTNNERNGLAITTFDQTKNQFIVVPNKNKISESVPTQINEFPFIPPPIIQAPITSFKDSISLKAFNIEPDLVLEITQRADTKTMTGKEVNENDKVLYTGVGNYGTSVYQDGIYQAKAQDSKGNTSTTTTYYARKRTVGLELLNATKADKLYTAGSDDALIDGLRGNTDFRAGRWQGFQGKPVEIVLDLGKTKHVDEVIVSSLQEIKSWIWYPSKIDVFVSNDVKLLTTLAQTVTYKPEMDGPASTREFTLNINQPCRFIRLVATPAFEKIPNWHLGAGGQPWIFMDEIIVK